MATAHGMEVRGPRVLSDRSNLLVRLAPAPVVARVATSTAAARAGGAFDWLARDLALAGFLASQGAAVVAPASELPPGPHVEDGLAITYWRFVEHDPEHPATPGESGATRSNLLRRPAGLLWTDFEDTCSAPAEWDLACLVSSMEPAAGGALEAYGPPRGEALEPFVEVRRLQAALWTALVAERHPELQACAASRLSRWAG